MTPLTLVSALLVSGVLGVGGVGRGGLGGSQRVVHGIHHVSAFAQTVFGTIFSEARIASGDKSMALNTNNFAESKHCRRNGLQQGFCAAYDYMFLVKVIVDVKCAILEDCLEIIIEDHGRGFTEDDKPEANKVGIGLGLTFIESLMDNLEIDSVIGRGTKVIMKKNRSDLNEVI